MVKKNLGLSAEASEALSGRFLVTTRVPRQRFRQDFRLPEELC